CLVLGIKALDPILWNRIPITITATHAHVRRSSHTWCDLGATFSEVAHDKGFRGFQLFCIAREPQIRICVVLSRPDSRKAFQVMTGRPTVFDAPKVRATHIVASDEDLDRII